MGTPCTKCLQHVISGLLRVKNPREAANETTRETIHTKTQLYTSQLPPKLLTMPIDVERELNTAR